MREFLFRGKAKAIAGCPYNNGKSDGEWVFGYIFPDLGAMKIRQFEPDRPECNDYEVDPETVGQYTGLTDKNGVRIFEGDIFKFDDEIWESSYTSCGTEYDSFAVENYGVVGFDEEMARFDFIKYKFSENSVEADLHENHTIDFSEFVCELEVIGNIHDNLEMLNAAAKDIAFDADAGGLAPATENFEFMGG